ncbi:MAG TPA: zf-HC2 domain-containing protein, partial [Anaerolineales bacterium]|nr:zf-HC2 domain-containing protein [Anaerolineales bacterium]
MNCEQVQSLLLSYLDGEITPSERALILAHLSGCTVCQQELDLLSTARSRVRSALQRRAVQAVPSREAWSRLEAMMTESAQPSSRFATWFSRMARGAGHAFNRNLGDITMRKRYILGSGATVLILILVAILMFQRVVPVS